MPEEIEEVKGNELDVLKEEAAEGKNKLLRALADFDNFKKRAAQEREQFVQFANEALITELLPIIDGFARAMEHAPEKVTKGIALIKKQFEDVLKKYGIAEIETLGKTYDPNLHEAILQKDHDGPDGIIIEEMQKGYTLYKRVIRPAMVIVSKKGVKSDGK